MHIFWVFLCLIISSKLDEPFERITSGDPGFSGKGIKPKNRDAILWIFLCLVSYKQA